MRRSLVKMNHLCRSLAVLCVLYNWTIADAAGCGDQRAEVNGQCCDLCLPGTYMKEFCTEHQQTVCSPCEEGYFSNAYNIFDRCEKCRSCQHEYAEKCTLTTNANCSCSHGFLCSSNVCSTCEENKCIKGEKLKRTDNSLGNGLTEYSYECEPLCPDNSYFEVKEGACKPRTQCSLFGFAERFPGNKTQNSVCDGIAWHRNSSNVVHVITGIGFILLSLTILVLISNTCVKKQRRQKSCNIPLGIPAVSTKTSDFHLSQEESGLSLNIRDETKNSDDLFQLDVENVCSISLR